MSYLRANYRMQVGYIRLIYHSDSTAGYLTGLAPATGLLCISANASDLLLYAGDRFVYFAAAASTGA